MLSLKSYFSNSGKTKDIYFKMVDKFKSNEGSYYSHPLLDDALKQHNTTSYFHKSLKKCLMNNIKNGTLDDDIINLSREYMQGEYGASLPHFEVFSGFFLSDDLFNGTVLTVHGIWAMEVYAESLEYKGDFIRGVFKYKIQDHFGLNVDDIDHPELDSLPFETLSGFCSWYLLQHYKNYDYKPFITEIRFKLS